MRSLAMRGTIATKSYGSLNARRVSGIASHHTHERQFAEGMRHIHAVTHDEVIWALKAHEIRLNACLPAGTLVEKDGYRDGPCTARQHQVAGEFQRLARFQNVIDEQDVPAVHIAFDVAQHLDLSAGGAGAIAGDHHELHLGRYPRVIHGPDEIGGEDKRTF